MKLLHIAFERVRLERLISLLTIAAVVVATACLMLVVHLQLRADAERKSIESQQLSLRIAAELLSATHPGTRVVWGEGDAVERIVMDKIPDDQDHALVDSMTRMTGE